MAIQSLSRASSIANSTRPVCAEARLSWKIVADAVLSAKARPKAGPKKEPPKRDAPASGPPLIHPLPGGLNDDVPF